MQKIEIQPGVKGLIFDLDGTIADTMPAHYIAWRNTLKNHGIDFTIDLFLQLAGIPLEGTIKQLNEIFGTSMDPLNTGLEKENAFLATIHKTKVVEPVAEIIREYHGKMPMSVGTGGQRSVATETLKATGMDKYFDIVVTSDDITHPKPHPETFLKCAEQMGIAPEDCQVFEDGVLGKNAAKEAGMKLVDVTDYYEVTIGHEE
ncbi:HAD family hydrolase [Marinilabilia rubra]|uniref:Phosphatase n=1 Tax=Marinilabilia rubra TaxID=2162893 RepID=A0A2U2BCL4_9BACT|nr:HAD-IA family hydrolase [Marinilabilia rubra]PWE00816.1 phosphatase [Marinilabilia rubra]